VLFIIASLPGRAGIAERIAEARARRPRVNVGGHRLRTVHTELLTLPQARGNADF
jgi:hypothetical protein